MLVATDTTTFTAARLPQWVFTLAITPTAWGFCGVVWKYHKHESIAGFAQRPDHALLCRIYTPGLTIPELRRHMLAQFPAGHEVLSTDGGISTAHAHFHPQTVPDWLPCLVAYLQDYYTTALRTWSRPQYLDHWNFWQSRLAWEQLTAFQRRVLDIVARIPPAADMTYGQIAQHLGNPHASRAVGAAVAHNPWPVLIPCHRVLGSNGKLTGFSAPGGIETKRRMLEFEHLNSTQS